VVSLLLGQPQHHPAGECVDGIPGIGASACGDVPV
jgi:hypothetical protein